MSNPGVIKLAEKAIGGHTLRIEDNIGEAIHIHYDDIRLDMSIKEFCELRNQLAQIVENIIDVEGFSYSDYDPVFLLQASNILIKLNQVKTEKRIVKDLLTNSFDRLGRQSLIPISESRVCKEIQGDGSLIMSWKQYNYDNLNNIERFTKLYDSIKNKGYINGLGSSIVLCDGGQYVWDGCHRTSILYMDNPELEVEIKMWITGDNCKTDESVLEYMNVFNQNVDNLIHARDLWIRRSTNMVKLYLESVLAGKRIIFKGAGKHTKKLLDLIDWKKKDITIVGMLANDKSSTLKNEISILDESDLNNNIADLIIISSYKFRNEMKQELYRWSDKYEIIDIYDECVDGEFFSGICYSVEYPWKDLDIND